jgi:fructose-1,6-bisphosphatase
MKMQKLLIAILLAMFATLSVAQPEDAALRKDVENFMAKTERLIASGSPQLWSLFHPNYTAVNTQGKRKNLAEFKQQWRQMASTTKNLTIKLNVKHVRGNESEAFAWVEEVVHFTVKENGRWVKQISTTRWAETIVKTSTGWRFMYSQELPMDEPWPFKVG